MRHSQCRRGTTSPWPPSPLTTREAFNVSPRRARFDKLLVKALDRQDLSVRKRRLSGKRINAQLGRFLIRNSAFGGSFNIDEADEDGVTYQTGDIAYAEAFHQLGAVSFDGFDADSQFLCDLFGGPAFRDETKDFTLTRA